MSPLSAGERLERILRILPEAVKATDQDGGIRLSELASRLDLPESAVAEALTEAAERAHYLPPGRGDDLQITIEDDRIRVWTTGEFRRPLRLTGEEAAALGLGLRRLALGHPRREELLALARRLEERLSLVDPDAHGAGGSGKADREPAFPWERLDAHLAVEAPGGSVRRHLETLERCAETRTACRFGYVKPGAAGPEERVVEPYHLVHAEGAWYLLGRSRKRDDVRIFRLDRMSEPAPVGETFEVPEDFDPSRHITAGIPYRADEDVEARVRYSPTVARWIRERWEGREEPDGSYVVTHRVADATWFVRHVLRYGPDAEVLAPAELREAVRDAARRVAG